MKTMNWAGELTDLFGKRNTETIHKAIQDLRINYNGEYDASALLEKLDRLPLAEAHWTFTSAAAMILITLTIFLVLVLICKKCC
jgi:hypothetical protein